MEETLSIRVPDEVRRMLNRTHEEMGRDVRLYAALMLFHLGKLSSGAAANMAGVPRVMFLDHCAEYGIPISQITGAELAGEIDAG
jgi:predicted HTH domain antitoxin